MRVRILMIGFGNVGRELGRALVEMAGEIERISGLEICVTGVAFSRGSAALDEGSWRARLSELVEAREKGSLKPFSPPRDPLEMADRLSPDLAMVTLPPSYSSGEPNLTIYRGLLERGVSIVTADKTGLATSFWELFRTAEERGLYMGFRATVMAGTPVTDLIKGLAGRNIEIVEGILNATTNYVLTLVEKGLSFPEAVRRAVDEKLAEPDPSIDIGGLDAAAKITILANLAGAGASVRDVKRIPVDSVGEEEVRRARAAGRPVKQVARADLRRGVLVVGPEALDAEDPLARVVGNYNGVRIRVEEESIVLTGPTGPAWRTARTMVTDLLEYLGRLRGLRPARQPLPS